ncbi:MAG TPA: phosphoenolpyruvate--protein phosphotransferase, partial [Kofleriaceae bacterium]|nr:phosphoenolpyruvate--protein phosphotransferase [Kofleriaceae bacterium]
DAVRAPDVARDGAGAAVELARLASALADVRGELERTIAGAQARGDAAAADILRTHLDLVDDPELCRAAEREIGAGRSAGWAWRTALDELAAVLRGLGNPILAERTGDLVDLERRTLARLAGDARGRVPDALPDGAVLFADELLPSELAALPAGRIAGLCTARGGSTSHAAILAAGLGVPAVVAIGGAAARVPDGAPVIVDGDRGRVRVFPAAATRDAVERAIAGRAARRRAELDRAHEPARTSDGVDVAVLANLGSVGDAAIALASGADGCGLLRTEFAFVDRLERHTPPSEDDQAARYQQIADALQGRPLVIRTLDAGGDKPLAFAPQAREDNPALGVRGVRLALRHPELLRTQLRAILRVAPAGACQIMVPMIASLAELRAVRAMLDDERRALALPVPVALGAMIEVPAAALLADALAREADFFSIGTNDLAQYALAMDRGNPDVASGLDSLHPGVLRLVSSTVAGARAHGRPVSVCGGAAADPVAVAILLGLGIRTLSVAPAAVPAIKAVVRTLSATDCEGVAARALALDGSDAVRALVGTTWPGLVAHSSSPS